MNNYILTRRFFDVSNKNLHKDLSLLIWEQKVKTISNETTFSYVILTCKLMLGRRIFKQ